MGQSAAVYQGLAWRPMTLTIVALVAVVPLLSLMIVAWRPMAFLRLWLEFRCRRSGLVRTHVQAGGTRWPVFRSGAFKDRTVSVILHGFGVDSFSMLAIATTLSKAGHSVLMPDLPGFGDHTSDSPHTLDETHMLDALDALATATAAERVIVIGSSMGGALAAAWAHRDSDRVIAAVLLNPAGVEPPVVNEVYASAPGDDHPLDIRTMADFNRVLTLNFVHIPRIPWIIKRDVVRIARRRANAFETIIRTLEPLLRNGLRDRLPEIDQPVLLIWGEADRIIDPSVVLLWDDGLPDVDIMTLEQCGHVPWVDCPVETRAAIGRFVEHHATST